MLKSLILFCFFYLGLFTDLETLFVKAMAASEAILDDFSAAPLGELLPSGADMDDGHAPTELESELALEYRERAQMTRELRTHADDSFETQKPSSSCSKARLIYLFGPSPSCCKQIVN